MSKFLFSALILWFFSSSLLGFGPRKVTLRNSGFEDGIGYWSNGGDDEMSQPDSDAAYRGSFGLRVIDQTETRGSSLLSKPFRVKPGEEYEVTFWARSISGKGVAVYLRFRDKDKTLLNSNVLGNELLTVIPEGATGWKKYKVEGVAPLDAQKGEVWIHSFVKSKASADIDEISVMEKS